MAIQMGKAIAFTAVGGMVAGLVGCGGAPEAPKMEDAAKAGAEAAGAKACCKGKNECKAKGNCKTDKNDCKGKNECKAKGGCKAADCAEAK
jgi:hypothetical protein